VPTKKPLGADEKAQDAITHAIAHMDRSRLIEVLAQMKAFVITYPKRARQFLSHHPQVAYAIVMGLLTSKTIPEDILSPML
ncbi:cleavage stimulation factor subunit 2, hinge domain-containing protein, partial [Mycena olivaceomarginata]